MKTAKRAVAATVLVLIVSLSGPELFAARRDGDAGIRIPGPVAKIIAKIQKVIGLVTHDDLPTPPRP
jgi:hypothetical protein